MIGTLWDVLRTVVLVGLGVAWVDALLWNMSSLLDPNDRLRIRTLLDRVNQPIDAAWQGLGAALRPLIMGLLDLAIRAYDRTITPMAIAYVRWSARGAARHLAWARRGFGRDRARILPPSHAVRTAVRSWYSSMPFASVSYVVKTIFFLLVTLNIGAITAGVTKGTSRLWEQSEKATKVSGGIFPPEAAKDHGTTGGTDGALDPLLALIGSLRRMGGAVADKAAPYLPALANPLGRPVEAVTAASGIVLLGVSLLALRVALTAVVHALRNKNKEGPTYLAPSPKFQLARGLLSLRVGRNRRNRPVMVLVNCLGRVGAAHSSYRLAMRNRHPLTAPRVHLADAERVVWSAWRTRHTFVRGAQRVEYKRHAERVVGALRAVEARQDTDADTGRVLEDMARMLAKIAERYAQGRTLALLDPEDLTETPTAVNREWVRLVILVVAVAGAAAGASALGLSGTMTSQIVGGTSLVMVALLYGARLAPTDLLDVVRGQSRK